MAAGDCLKKSDSLREGISTRCITSSGEETIQLGKILGSLLTKGDIIALVGELGSGKTLFTKGLAIGLGIDPEEVVTSPSFALVNEYVGRFTFYHMDLYRLDGLSDVFMAGLYEYLFEDAVVVMEWADRWPEILPEYRIMVEIIIIDEFQREVKASAFHNRSMEIIENFEKEVNKG